MTEAPRDVPRVVVDLPPAGSGARLGARRRRRRRQRLVRTAFAGAMVVLVLAIPVLGYVGFHRVFTSTGGRRIDAQNDPSKPRFEVNVAPTPVLLLAQTDTSGALVGVTLLVLGAGDRGGAVLFAPPATVSTPKTGSATTLAAAFATGGTASLDPAARDLFGLSFDQLVEVSDDQWAQFMTPVAPLSITNPDKLVTVDAQGRTKTLFAAGPLTLAAGDVSVYLEARNPGESDLARLARDQIVWRAWLAAVKTSTDPNVVPGETSAGLGRYVRGLARGDVSFNALAAQAAVDSAGATTYTADPATVAATITGLVPLPTPAEPGDRVRIRVLSGVGPVDLTGVVAAKLLPPNAQLTTIGNADRFDYDTTQIVYSDDAFAAAANELQQAFGAGEVVKSPTPSDSEDVTVVIGKDLVAKRGLKISSSSGGTGG